MQVANITAQATSNLEVKIPDGEKNIILYFYPKDSTPGCTTEGGDFRDNYQEFIDNNCLIYGVSRDSLKSHENFKAKQNYPFELISDLDEELCNTFGVMGLKKLYGKEYMGLIRSTFVIAPTGEVLKEWRNVKVKNHISEVLEFIKSL
jgi:peroxiredoxin Q/BCP